jgi:hypothetical protein
MVSGVMAARTASGSTRPASSTQVGHPEPRRSKGAGAIEHGEILDGGGDDVAALFLAQGHGHPFDARLLDSVASR